MKIRTKTTGKFNGFFTVNDLVFDKPWIWRIWGQGCQAQADREALYGALLTSPGLRFPS